MHSPLAKKVAVSALAPLLASPHKGELELLFEELYMKTLRSLSERDFSVLLALPAVRIYEDIVEIEIYI